MTKDRVQRLLEDKFVWIEGADMDFYMEAIEKCSDWHYAKGDEYRICCDLSTAGLLAEKTIPQWNNDSFQGFKHYYKRADYEL